MIIRFLLPLVLLATGLYILFGAISASGFSLGGIFTDEAEVIRAEAELKRVDVEMVREQAEHVERMELIKHATAPRTPAMIIGCLFLLTFACVGLVLSAMRERQRRRFLEFKLEALAGNASKKTLPEPAERYLTGAA